MLGQVGWIRPREGTGGRPGQGSPSQIPGPNRYPRQPAAAPGPTPSPAPPQLSAGSSRLLSITSPTACPAQSSAHAHLGLRCKVTRVCLPIYCTPTAPGSLLGLPRTPQPSRTHREVPLSTDEEMQRSGSHRQGQSQNSNPRSP